jgi:inward rectifier potassium channel
MSKLGRNADQPRHHSQRALGTKKAIAVSIAERQKSRSLLVGDYAVRKTGIARFDWRDPYYFAVALSWPQFLLSLIALFVVINLSFGLLYLMHPGSLTNAHPGSLSDAFFFSLETATTVGYGDIYPADIYGRTVAGCEMMVGVAFTALTTGLLFVRFSRPKARIRYAKNAVVAMHNGQPTLMIRIANGRLSLISNAAVHLGLMRTNRRADGKLLRQIYELPLIRSRLPLFSLTWTLMHRIDMSSPLIGYDAARLIEDDVRLWVSIEGHDNTLATTISDTQAYGPAEVLYGMRYAGTISADAEGHPTVDLGELSQVEPDSGPEPPESGWVDAR